MYKTVAEVFHERWGDGVDVLTFALSQQRNITPISPLSGQIVDRSGVDTVLKFVGGFFLTICEPAFGIFYLLSRRTPSA